MGDIIPAYLTRAQSRAVDEIAIGEFGMLGLVLMENAGRNCAEFITRYIERHDEVRGWRIVICCGKGNNGGDGFVIARHLIIGGFEPIVLLWANADGLSGDAAANFAILEKMRAKIVRLGESNNDADWEATLAAVPRGKAIVVDALLGTGAVGEPRAPYDRAISWINSLGAIVVAIDLPSGLDADSGKASQHTIEAAHTLTFVAQKVGFAAACARAFLGGVHVIDIGVPPQVMEAALAR